MHLFYSMNYIYIIKNFLFLKVNVTLYFGSINYFLSIVDNSKFFFLGIWNADINVANM